MIATADGAIKVRVLAVAHGRPVRRLRPWLSASSCRRWTTAKHRLSTPRWRLLMHTSRCRDVFWRRSGPGIAGPRTVRRALQVERLSPERRPVIRFRGRSVGCCACPPVGPGNGLLVFADADVGGRGRPVSWLRPAGRNADRGVGRRRQRGRFARALSRGLGRSRQMRRHRRGRARPLSGPATPELHRRNSQSATPRSRGFRRPAFP